MRIDLMEVARQTVAMWEHRTGCYLTAADAESLKESIYESLVEVARAQERMNERSA